MKCYLTFGTQGLLNTLVKRLDEPYNIIRSIHTNDAFALLVLTDQDTSPFTGGIAYDADSLMALSPTQSDYWRLDTVVGNQTDQQRVRAGLHLIANQGQPHLHQLFWLVDEHGKRFGALSRWDDKKAAQLAQLVSGTDLTSTIYVDANVKDD